MGVSIKELLLQSTQVVGSTITVQGWVRAFRSNRFLQINDGSTLGTLQAVIDFNAFPEEELRKLTTAAAVKLSGEVVESIGSGQSIELLVKNFEVLGLAAADDVQRTVMQPKRHS